MSIFSLLPLLVFAACSTLTWAVGKFNEAASAQRAHDRKFPRSRPYPLTMPASLLED